MSHISPQTNHVRVHGRCYEVLERVHINRRRYEVLERLGSSLRPRLLLRDPYTNQLRVALILERCSATSQHLTALRRLPQLPELPHILDIERRRGRLTIVLRWIRGIDLAEYFCAIDRRRAPKPSAFECVRLVRGLAHALFQLHHHAQVIHGDLKPQNLIITRKTSRLVMIDYGSAWPIEQTSRRHEGDGLSPVFAAPELQTHSDRSVTHADQFSAGVILYRLLTGRIPYTGLGGQVGRPGYIAECGTSLEPPSIYPESISRLPRKNIAQLDQICMRLLAVDPGDRFSSTAEWLETMEVLYLQLKLRSLSPKATRSLWQRGLDRLVDLF